MKPRSTSSLIALGAVAALILCVSCFLQFCSLITTPDLTVPLVVETTSLFGNGQELLTLTYTAATGAEYPIYREPGKARWRFENGFLKRLHVHADAQAVQELDQIRVRLGDQEYRFTGSEFRAQWKRLPAGSVAATKGSGSQTWEMPNRPDSRLAAWTGIQNWSEDGRFLREVCRPALLLFLVSAAGVVLLRQPRARRWLETAQRKLTRESVSRGTPAAQDCSAGLLLLIAALSFLEWRQPFYFTQDDNFSQFLPVIVQGCRAVAAGQWPLLNPHQLLGAPTLSLGVYALTYPLTYLSYFVAAVLLRQETLTLEVFAWIHLLAAYGVMHTLLRRLPVRRSLAVAGALSFTLSGYFLVAGRSWYYMLPVALWMPWLLLRLLDWRPGTHRFTWALTTGTLIGLFFHAGNAQMWIYGLGLWVLAVVLLTLNRTLPREILPAVGAAVLAGLAWASPLLLLQLRETRDIERFGGLGAGLTGSLWHCLLPLGPLAESHGMWGGFAYTPRGEVYYGGAAFVVFSVAAALVLLLVAASFSSSRTFLKQVLRAHPWLVLMAVALVAGLGHQGILWTVLSFAPVFNKFNVPAKFLAYIHLFAILSGAMLWDRLVRSERLQKGLLALTAATLAIHLHFATDGFFTWGERPYAELPAAMRAQLDRQPGARILSTAAERDHRPGYFPSLYQNFASFTGGLSVEGYDPLVAATPENRLATARWSEEPVEAARAYGVQWLIVHRSAEEPAPLPLPAEWRSADLRRMAAIRQLQRYSRLVYQDEFIQLWHFDLPAPMAFSQQSPGSPLSLSWTAHGVDCVVSQQPVNSVVTVGLLDRPWYHAYLDGRPVTKAHDRWGRLTIRLPHPGAMLSVRYELPLLPGCLASLLCVALIWPLLHFTRKRPHTENDAVLLPLSPRPADVQGSTQQEQPPVSADRMLR